MPNDKKIPNVPNLRFHNFNKPWKTYELIDVVDRIKRKNINLESNLPLTISAQYGLINQKDFFGKNVASNNLRNYYLLFNGDFAYNKSYSKDYPWGATKRLNLYDKGVISNLYICFRPKNINSSFLEKYFETNKWHRQISDIAGEGARNHGLLNMSTDGFFHTKHRFPEIPEQEKIGLFIEKLQNRIITQNKIIEDLNRQREYYLNFEFNKFKNHSPIKFNELFRPYKILNKDNLKQYTIGKYGIKEMEQSNLYSVNKHIVFKRSSLILGIGIEECGVSLNVCGCCSPIYKTFSINNDKLNPLFVNYFIKYYLNLNKRFITQKSTRREYEINYSELENIPLFIPNLKIQNKISTFFSILDSKIKTEEKLLETFVKQKKYFLINLFI